VLKGWATQGDGLAYLRKFFAYIGKSKFLTGHTTATKGRPAFQAELAWVCNEANWAKIHEGKYHEE